MQLLTDLYQVNMAYAHWQQGTHMRGATFDLFFRRLPFAGGFAVAAGMDEAVQFLRELRLADDDLDYLRSLGLYPEPFIQFLARELRFTGDFDAVPEGTLVFPGEPIARITAPIFLAQYVETPLLNLINHQTLIATKAARVRLAAGRDPVIEMGCRRAQGPGAAVRGARAAYIGGVDSTSNVEAGRRYGIPVAGTNAHAWVQFHPTELAAFRAWAAAVPELVFLVDTYDTLRSGLPNAIRVARETGKPFKAVRLDSGDLAYLSRQARAMLDEAGFTETKVLASSDLDEYLIQDLKHQGARIDGWGVGTSLITAKDDPALGGVYKLAGVETEGGWAPRIKLSENPAKLTLPGRKKVVRFIKEGKLAGDLIMLEEEPLPDPGRPFTLADPVHPWKRKTLEGFEVEELLMPMLAGGAYVGPPAGEKERLAAARRRCAEQLGMLWDEFKRFKNPHIYHVDLSDRLRELQLRMVEAERARAAEEV